MATDKSAPALPKVGEVWVALDANPVAAHPTMFEVMCATTRRVEVIIFDANESGEDMLSVESYTYAEWHRITRRAVRVDDKEAGR